MKSTPKTYMALGAAWQALISSFLMSKGKVSVGGLALAAVVFSIVALIWTVL